MYQPPDRFCLCDPVLFDDDAVGVVPPSSTPSSSPTQLLSTSGGIGLRGIISAVPSKKLTSTVKMRDEDEGGSRSMSRLLPSVTRRGCSMVIPHSKIRDVGERGIAFGISKDPLFLTLTCTGILRFSFSSIPQLVRGIWRGSFRKGLSMLLRKDRKARDRV